MVTKKGNATVVLFLLFLLLYWHVLSHLILPVKSANEPLSGMLSETTAVMKTRPLFANCLCSVSHSWEGKY